MNNYKKIKIGFTIGDPAGIGIEIIIKTLEKREFLKSITPIIFGSTKLINYQIFNIFKNKKIYVNEILKEEEALYGKINILNIWKDLPLIKFGHPNKESARLALESLDYATKSLKNNKIAFLITAPVNKNFIQKIKFDFIGHTQYLEKKFNDQGLMFMVSDHLNIALVTNHIPIKQISSTITKKLIIDKTIILNKTLIQDFKIEKPKIAILGLNPHSGDNSLLGREEKEIIEPAIKKLFHINKILAFGPFPADSFFNEKKIKNFNAVLAMYHDQGLIPFKMLSFEEGVNFTAGIKKIRISPTHGVAYDIAGKGIASENSIKSSILKAIEIYKNRLEYEDIKKKSLRFLSKKIIDNEK